MSTYHPDPLELDMLATQIRELHQRIESNALERGLDAGDLLIQAQSLVPNGGWKRWLKSCQISVSTAELYIQLARHRAKIEAAGVCSIRKARKLIAVPRTPKFKEQKPKPTIIFRKALSHVKAARNPGSSEAVVTSNNNEALTSLCLLVTLLMRDGADISDVSLVVSRAATQQRRRAA